MAQLRDQGSSDVPPAFSDKGSKPAPMPALEQNSAIGPNCFSVSSMTWRMSFSWPTSHLNAAPSIEAATILAPSISTSATITFAAPARWRTSQSARPMPLAPPVTTTILPVTCIATCAFLKSISGQNEIEHGGVMAGRAQQHKGMPDHVLEAQPLPGVEDHTQTIQRSARDYEPKRHGRQRRHDSVIEHEAAPTHRQIEADGEPVETARQHQFEHDPDNRHAPHADQERDGEDAILQLRDERRIGRRDQHIDRRMIEAAQHPLGTRHWPQIVSRRQ